MDPHTTSTRSLFTFLCLAASLTGSCKSCESSPGEAHSPAGEPQKPAAAKTPAHSPSAASSAPRASSLEWKEPLTLASGSAYAGPWRMNESKFYYLDDPSVAVSDGGAYAVAWVDNRRQDVFFQMIAGSNEKLDEPVNASNNPETFSWLPRVVVAPDDASQVFLLWQEIIFSGGSHGGEALFARSTDGGRSFEEPINLSTSIAGDGKGRLTEKRWDNGSLDLARTGDGTLLAAWTEYEGNLWLSRSSDDGRSFSKPLRVAGSERAPARGPSLAVQADGTLHLAWTIGERAGADVWYARSSDGGRSFGEAERAVSSDGHSDAPKVAVDARGTVHLVYAESPAGPFRRYHVRYARRAAAAEGFEASRPLTAVAPERGAAASFPGLAVDGQGHLYVIWEHHPGPDEARGLGFTWSDDGGDSFAAPALVPGMGDPELGVNGSLQGKLMNKLAVNRQGTIGVVNSRFDRGEQSLVRLLRGRGP